MAGEMADENSIVITEINHIWKYIKIEQLF